jgi:hypothetical protein
VASIGEPRIAAALSLGYGYTEALAPNDGAHHRAIAVAAVSATPTRWLSFALRSDGRYDRHPGGDDGWIADPALLARLGGQAGEHAHVGLEAGVRFSGAEDGSTTLQSASPAAALQLGWTSGGLSLGAQGGYRLDRSAEAGGNAARLSFGDRISLGLSDFDAVTAGLGLAYRFGATELLAELSADLLVGNGAPPLGQSPLRASAGVRQHLSEAVQASLLVESCLSSRPAVAPADPLVPIEPRVAVLAGIGFRFDLAAKAIVSVPAPTVGPQPVSPQAPPPNSLTIRITDANGKPVPDAKVTLQTRNAAHEARADSDGKASFTGVPAGHATLTIERDGYEPLDRDIEIDPSRPTDIKVDLTPRAQGQVRGLIRAFSGAGIAAKVRVEPLGAESKADAQGYFEIDVPPGKYEVVIEAPGYRPQRRTVEVQKDGVVVLNADLYKK